LVYDKLNLDVLDGDGIDGTQVALDYKFERSKTSNNSLT
jgi:hypothetical protein